MKLNSKTRHTDLNNCFLNFKTKYKTSKKRNFTKYWGFIYILRYFKQNFILHLFAWSKRCKKSRSASWRTSTLHFSPLPAFLSTSPLVLCRHYSVLWLTSIYQEFPNYLEFNFSQAVLPKTALVSNVWYLIKNELWKIFIFAAVSQKLNNSLVTIQ